MTKALSCGVVLLNEEGDVLLGHCTGSRHWDIPKGGTNPGEQPLETALRETREETGLLLDANRLIDLGEYEYRPEKELHLFAGRLTGKAGALDKLNCTSMFISQSSGEQLPEMDNYRWVKPTQISDYCSKSLYRLFATKLSLFDLHQRLA